MSGFRVRSRRRRRRSRPGMTVWGGKTAPKHFFLYSVDSISVRFIFPPSCPTERGDRDRHVRGAGCGGRRRCGVTRFGGDVCLRAGRICASTATGKETAGLRMDRPLDSVTDDQVKTRSAYSLEAPFPSPWDFNSRSERSSRQSASNRKNTAGGTSGTCSAPPKVLMHTNPAEDRIASGPRVQRAPGVPHALSQGAGNARHDGAPAPQTMGAMTHV